MIRFNPLNSRTMTAKEEAFEQGVKILKALHRDTLTELEETKKYLKHLQIENSDLKHKIAMLEEALETQ